MSKNAIIKGTIILTIAGFLTRFIGFFYRIFLSNTLGAENLGVYQLIFPVYSICFTLYASGIQTSISSFIAAEMGKKQNRNVNRILKTGLFFSISIAFIISNVLFHCSDFIATNLILEPRCASSLRVLALVFPFCGITSCINGYYYGLKKAFVPATTQLLEQLVRVLSVYLIATFAGSGNLKVTCEIAVVGLIFGELASNVYNISSLIITKKKQRKDKTRKAPDSIKPIAKGLLKLSIPLTSNRLLISILNSVEAILIPAMLRKHGLSTTESLSIFGILVGMAMPFIWFPSTITNSFAVMLLPTVSEAQAAKDNGLISRTTSMSMKYSLILGILSTVLFIVFGDSLGNLIYHNQTAGDYLMILAWLCPFIYLTTTLGSIINGLGKTHITFLNTVAGLSIQILFVIFLVPLQGIRGYLIGILVSHLIICILDCLAILRNIKIHFDAINWILKPGLIAAFLGNILMQTYQYFIKANIMPQILLLFISCIIFILSFIILLFITKSIKREEFRKV